MRNLFASLLLISSMVFAQESKDQKINFDDFDKPELFENLNQIAPIETNQITKEMAQELIQKILSNKELGLKDYKPDFKCTNSESFVYEDIVIIRYQQYHKSIKVSGGYLNVVYRQENINKFKLKAISGYVELIKKELPATYITHQQALEKIKQHIETKFYPATPPDFFKDDTEKPVETTLYWDSPDSDDKNGDWRLVYSSSPDFWIEVENDAGFGGRWPIGLIISAETGELLDTYEPHSCGFEEIVYRRKK